MKQNRTHIPSLNPRILNQFGLRGTGEHDSIEAQSVRSGLRSGILDEQMQAIVAPFGSGKTYMFRQLKRQMAEKVKFVHVKAFDDRWIRIGSILTAMITDLAPSENVRRDIETRSRQVINILGELVVKQGKKVCLVIEDCHRLHLNTLNSLKLMREEDWAGRAPLFSVVLIGWPEFLAKISNRKDILWRMQVQELNADNGWYTERERVAYLDHVFGSAIEPETRKRIAKLHDTPEGLNYYVSEMMKKAYMAGYDVIDGNVVQPSLKERFEALKRKHGQMISLSSVGNVAGVGKSTVSLALESEPNTPSTDKVRIAIGEMEEWIQGGTEGTNEGTNGTFAPEHERKTA